MVFKIVKLFPFKGIFSAKNSSKHCFSSPKYKDENQFWFWKDSHLVSYHSQKALEASVINEGKIYLNYYDRNQNRQKWNKIGSLNTLDFEFATRHKDYRLDIIDRVTEEGSIVGSTKKVKNSLTQKWKIEEVADYEDW